MFVSVIVKIDEDIKKKSNMVKWNGHYTRIDGHSLWDAPLFEICETRPKSLKATMREWENGMTETVRVMNCKKLWLIKEEIF